MDFFNPRGKLNPSDVEYADNLIYDYLLFRGFLNTREAFQLENKADKNKGFQACIEQLKCSPSGFQDRSTHLWLHPIV